MINIKPTESNEGFYNQIKVCTCDVCGAAEVAVVLHHRFERPTLAECQACNPILFQAVSDAQKDAWLNGNN